MSWMRREHNVDWNRRRERDYEWQRAKRELRLLALFVVLSFALGMFVKNVGPIAVLGGLLGELFGFRGVGQ